MSHQPYDSYKQGPINNYNIDQMWEEQVSEEKLLEYHDKFYQIQQKDLDKWRIISKNIQQVTNSTEKLVQQDLKTILQLYTLLNQNDRINDGVNKWREYYLSDDHVLNYMLNNFCYEVAKYLIDEKMFNYSETLDLSNRVLQQSAYLFITTFEYVTPTIIYMLAYIFDHRKHYFNHNNKIQLPFQVQSLFELGQPIKQWLHSLKQGDEVDAIKTDKKFSKSCWSRAIISKVDEQHLHLQFKHSQSSFNRSVWKEGFEVRPKGSRVSDEEIQWRLDLEEGDYVDCCDTLHVFYASTILKTREQSDHDGTNIKQVLIGYRIYDKKGNKMDDKGNRFNGWGDQYDIWLDATNPRIQRYKSVSKQLFMKASTSYQEQHIDDFNDLTQLLEDEHGQLLEGQILHKDHEEYKQQNKNLHQDEEEENQETEEQEEDEVEEEEQDQKDEEEVQEQDDEGEQEYEEQDQAQGREQEEDGGEEQQEQEQEEDHEHQEEDEQQEEEQAEEEQEQEEEEEAHNSSENQNEAHNSSTQQEQSSQKSEDKTQEGDESEIAQEKKEDQEDQASDEQERQDEHEEEQEEEQEEVEEEVLEQEDSNSASEQVDNEDEQSGEIEDEGEEEQIYLEYDRFRMKRVYASPKQNQCHSLFQIQLINKFGLKGGFALILEKIEDMSSEDKWCGIDLLSAFMITFYSSQLLLNKRFVQEYGQRVIDALQKNILNSPPSNLRNFTKDKIDEVNIGLSSLLLRIYSIGQKIEMLEKFNLQIALQSFNSEFIKTQLQGLKTIMELLDQLQQERTADSLQSSQLKEWIHTNNIFTKLFKSDKYQLIAKAGDFFKFLLGENMIKQEHLEVLWSQSRKNDTELKLAIYKILKDSFYLQSFDRSIISFFIQKIDSCLAASDNQQQQQQQPQQNQQIQQQLDITVEDIDLIHSFTRYRSKDGEFLDKVRNIYWKVIQTHSDSQIDLLEEAIKSYCESYSFNSSKTTISKVFNYCIQGIDHSDQDKSSSSKDLSSEQTVETQKSSQNGTSNASLYNYKNTLSILKIIYKLVDSMYAQSSFSDSFNKKEAVSYLFVDKKIVHHLVNNIRGMKKQIMAKLGVEDNTQNISEQELDEFFPKSSYIDQIQQRIDFLSFIYQNLPNEIELTLEVISEVWDAVVVEGLIQKEKDIIYKWFSEMNTNTSSSQQICKEDLIQFFDSKLCRTSDLVGMTIEGFNCFKGIFCILNEKDLKMKKFYPQKQNTYNYQYMNQTYTPQIDTRTNVSFMHSIINNLFSTQMQQDFFYMMLDVPTNLKGIDALWELITLNKDNSVIHKALEFLNNLHTVIKMKRNYNLHYLRQQNFESSIVVETEDAIKRKYYQQAYEYLNKQISEGGDAEKIKRCIMVMESILDESEKKGNGGLKSLISMSQGELLTLHCELSFYSSDLTSNFIIKIYSNRSVIDLLYQVGLQIRSTYEEVILTVADTNRLIESKENGKSIAELRLKSGERILVGLKKGGPVKEEELVVNGEVNPKAVEIFKKWFWTFQVDEKMKNLQVAQFINSCTNDNCQETDQRVIGTMETYDKDKKGYLTEKNFINFYTSSCRSKPDIVRRNLATHGYRRDLKRFDEVTVESIDITQMPRYILSRDQKFFKMVFSLLEREDVGGITWNFLSRLPISPVLYEKMLRLEGIRGQEKPNWDSLFGGQSKYTLLYNLHAMEYLMEEENSSSSSMIASSNQSAELIEFKKTWRSDFICLGGFDHLFIQFKQLLQQVNHEMDSIQKFILSFILKIFKNYLVAALSTCQPWIFKAVARMGLTQVPLSAILLEIRKEIKLEDPSELKMRKKESELQQSLMEADLKRTEQAESSHKDSESAKVEESEQFLQLVKNLKEQKLTQLILNKFEFKELVSQLSDLCIKYLTSEKELQSEDRVIIEHSILTLSGVISSDVNTCEWLFQQPLLQQLLTNGIFFKDSQNIRKIISHSFFMISQSYLIRHQQITPAKNILTILMQNIPGMNNSNENCAQYFELFCGILDSLAYFQMDNNQILEWLDFNLLLSQIIQAIKTKHSSETRINSKTDKILVGLINLADRILTFKEDLKNKVGSLDQDDLVSYIFHKCLFDIQDHSEIQSEEIKKYDKLVVKCKGDVSRAAAFRLLVTLCKNCPQNLQILMKNGLPQLISMMSVPAGKTTYVFKENRNESGHVGLYNLSCICYMNAMIQQFFMTPTFRWALLMADDGIEEQIVEANYNRKKITCDDNLLHQMQQLFSYLQMSDRVDYNPIEFCYSFKDYANNSVDLGSQQDAQEFLNMIFDKIENGLKNTPFKRLLESIYGGKTQSQLICSNCKSVTNRYEQFYNLSLEVKNFKSIFESLDQFISDEVISDFKCESCQLKVDVTKRVSLKQLPNVLIIHLKRIIFDIEALTNIKLNNRIEFTKNINLLNYSSDYLQQQDEALNKNEEDKQELNEGVEEEDEESEQQKKGSTKNDKKTIFNKDDFEYRLAGVVVHTGTAEYGHYYSFIDSNRGQNWNDKANKETWFEFNDSMIRDFSINNLENECFGGKDNDLDDSGFNFSWFKNRDNSKNAYILVYEKIVKDPIELIFQDKDEMNNILQKLPITKYTLKEQTNEQNNSQNPNEGGEQEQAVNQERKIEVNYYDIGQYIPDKLFKKVWIDNHKFMFEKHILHENFQIFIKDIANSIDLPTLTEEDCLNGYFRHYDIISEENRTTYYQLLKMHNQMILDLLNKQIIIEDMVNRMIYLLQLVPDKCLEIFKSHVSSYFFNKDALIIKSIDLATRQFLSKFYSKCTSIIINYYHLSISDNVVPEDESAAQAKKVIVSFLDSVIGFIVEAQKCWCKTDSYFQFWENFCKSGEEQIKFMFHHNMPAKLIDFFLGEDSPLKLKKDYMNSRGNYQKYTHLSKVLTTLLLRTETLPERIEKQSKSNEKQEQSIEKYSPYAMKGDLFKCLYSVNFWEKLFSCDSVDSEAVRLIIVKELTNNIQISQIACESILRSLQRVSYDECKQYCNAITHILSIKDDGLLTERIHYLFGIVTFIPNIIMKSNMNKSNVNQYGIFGLYSLSDEYLHLKAPLQLEQSMTVLECIYTQRKISDSVSIQLLIAVMKLAIDIPQIRAYITQLPSPSLLFSSYMDFIQFFIDQYEKDSVKQKYQIFPAIEYAQLAIKIQTELQETLKNDETKIQHEDSIKSGDIKNEDSNTTADISQSEDKTESNEHLGEREQLYTIGKTRQFTILREAELKLSERFLTRIDIQKLSESNLSKEEEQLEFQAVQKIAKEVADNSMSVASIHERLVNTYITSNKPNHTSNLAFDQQFVQESYFLTQQMPTTSPWHAFFKTHQQVYYGEQSNQQTEAEQCNLYLLNLNQFIFVQSEKAMENSFKNADCILEYVVSNPTSSTIELKLNFTPSDLSNLNQKWLPQLGKYCKVKPFCTETVFAIAKQNLKHDWGNFSVDIQYSTYISQEIKSHLNFQNLEYQHILVGSTLDSPNSEDLKNIPKLLKLANLCVIGETSLQQKVQDNNDEEDNHGQDEEQEHDDRENAQDNKQDFEDQIPSQDEKKIYLEQTYSEEEP